MSPAPTQACSSPRRMSMEVARSASCSVCIPSSTSGRAARTCAAAATTSWLRMGLRFCGMVEEPTVPRGTGSSNSPNSCFMPV